MSARIQSFDEFWDFYVGEHSMPWTRRLHYVGTASAIACVAAFGRTRRISYLLAAAVAGYAPAWFSHFFIEGNRPATFKYPVWSLLADMKMFELMSRGLMDAEVARVMATKRPADSNGARTRDGEYDGRPPPTRTTAN